MRIFLLLKHLQKEITDTFKSFPFKAGEEYRTPDVYIGHIMPKMSMPTEVKKNAEAPFVVIRFLDGESLPDQRTRTFQIKVSFLCAVFSRESYKDIEAGYHDILNMIDRVLLVLNSRHYWLDNHWKCEDDIRVVSGLQKEISQIYDAGSHQHPLYGNAVVATFTTPNIGRPPFLQTDKITGE